MKTFTKSIVAIALLGTFTLGMSMDIESQLSAISSATDSERVDLINELKVEVQNMTPEQRQEAMATIRTTMGPQDGSGYGMGDGTGDMTQTRTQMRQRAQSANADGMQQIQGSQMSSQRRADASITMGAQGTVPTATDGTTMPTTSTTSTTGTGMFDRR